MSGRAAQDHFEDLRARILSTTRTRFERLTPRLDVTVHEEPGIYLVSHPGWSNVATWWQDLILRAEVTSRELKDVLGDYILFSELRARRIIEGNDSALIGEQPVRHFFLERLGIGLEDFLSRLFSYRERVAWLSAELLRLHGDFAIDHRRISFHTVLKALSGGPRAEQLFDAIHTTLRTLSAGPMDELSPFRHSYVHRLGFRASQADPHYFVERPDGTWHTLPGGFLRARHLVHLSYYAWQDLIRATRHLASLDVRYPGFSLHVAEPARRGSNDDEMALHKGVRTNVGRFTASFSCMKRCRGYKAEVRVSDDSVTSVDEVRNVLEEAHKLLLDLIPPFETENHQSESRMIIVDQEEAGAGLGLLFLTEGPASDQLPQRLTDDLHDSESMEFTRAETIDDSPLRDWHPWLKGRALEMLDGHDAASDFLKSETEVCSSVHYSLLFRTHGPNRRNTRSVGHATLHPFDCRNEDEYLRWLTERQAETEFEVGPNDD